VSNALPISSLRRLQTGMIGPHRRVFVTRFAATRAASRYYAWRTSSFRLGLLRIAAIVSFQRVRFRPPGATEDVGATAKLSMRPASAPTCSESSFRSPCSAANSLLISVS
jgi:hypothetical protein